MSSIALVDHCTFVVNNVGIECCDKILGLGFAVSREDKEGSIIYTFQMDHPPRSTINAFFDALEGKREPTENADSYDNDLPSYVIIRQTERDEGLSAMQTQCQEREAEEGSEIPRDENCDRMAGSQQTETVPKEIETVQDYVSESEDRDNDDLKRERVSEKTRSLQNKNFFLDNDFGQGKEFNRFARLDDGNGSDTELKDGERSSNRHDETKHFHNDSSKNTDRGSEGDRERKQRTCSAGEKNQSSPTVVFDASSSSSFDIPTDSVRLSFSVDAQVRSASGRAVSVRNHTSMKESYPQNTEQEEEDVDVDEGTQDASSRKVDRDMPLGIFAASREVRVENDEVESKRKATYGSDESNDNEEKYYDAKNDESSGDNQALDKRNESMVDGSPEEQLVLKLKGAVTVGRSKKMTPGEPSSEDEEDNNCQESRSSKDSLPLNVCVLPDEQANMVQRVNSSRPSKSEKEGNKASMPRSMKMTRGEYSSSEDEGENTSHKSRSSANESYPLLNQFPSPCGHADDDHRGDHHRWRQKIEDHDVTQAHDNTSSETAQTMVGENCTEEEENVSDEEEQGSTTYIFTKAKYNFAKICYGKYESVSRCLEEYEVKNSSYLVRTNNIEVIERLDRFNKLVKKMRIPKDLFGMYQKYFEEWGPRIYFEEAKDCVIVMSSAKILEDIGKRYPDIISPGLSHRATAMPTSRNQSNVHESTNTDAPSASGCQASSRERDTIPVGTDRFEGHRSSLRVRVYKANITLLPVDVIVNAANRHLKHGGGVASAISRAAGRMLKIECEKHITEKGRVDVTEHFASTGGNLKAKEVYHAVGPRWLHYKDDRQKCKQDLRLTILRCLLHAEEEKHRDIAFPSISAAIFKVPKEICVESYMKAVLHFERLRDTEFIKEIHFVDIDDSMVNAIRDQFISFWNSEPVEKELRYDSHALQKRIPPAAGDAQVISSSSIHGDRSSGSTRDSKSFSTKDRHRDTHSGGGHYTSSERDDSSNSYRNTGTKTDDYGPSGHGPHSASSRAGSSGSDVSAHVDTGTHWYDASASASWSSSVDEPSMLNKEKGAHGYGDQTPSRGTSDRLKQKSGNASSSSASPSSYATVARSGSGGPYFKTCEICFDRWNEFTTLRCCANSLCTWCFKRLPKPQCPFCQKLFGILKGDMPDGTMMVHKVYHDLAGHPSSGTHYEIKYFFDETSQSKKPYRIAYLPCTDTALNVLRLLALAFYRRLTFTKGRSVTTGKDDQITWNDIHHKTTTKRGEGFGYPDPDYFRRVYQELEIKGVTNKSMTERENNYVKTFLQKLNLRAYSSISTPTV